MCVCVYDNAIFFIYFSGGSGVPCIMYGFALGCGNLEYTKNKFWYIEIYFF